MALPADRTNIGLILIKKDAAAENMRVPPFILQALLISAGSVNVANVFAANNALNAYIRNTSFQNILKANEFTTNSQKNYPSAISLQPAVYYNITTGNITQIIYDVTTGTPDDNPPLKIIQFTKVEIDEFLDIYHTLPNSGSPTRVDAENVNNGYFATRIKLVTTVFAKIYDKLKTSTSLSVADKKTVDDGAIRAIQFAYATTVGVGAVSGTLFTRFFKTIIIEGGLASTQSGLEKATSVDVTNTTSEVELAMHYTDLTTVGSSTLFNKVETIVADEKKLKLFFTDYLKAKIEQPIKGGFRRRRNRKSSKRRSQKKSSKRRKSRRSRNRRSRRIRRRSHRK